MDVRIDPEPGRASDTSASDHDDPELVRRLGTGDENALRVLHQRYAALVFTVCARYLDTAAAEDVVQDVFLTLWRKHQTFDPARGSFKSWIVQIARNRALNHLRSKHRRARHDEEGLAELADGSLEPDESQWLEHRRAVIRAAVDALPQAQRQALSMAFFDELSHEQIAAFLGTPLGTTKTRIRLALRRLAPILFTLLSAVSIALAVRLYEERAAQNEQALRMITASDVVPLRLHAGPGLSADAHGTYRTRPGARLAVLTTSHLPALTASGSYVAWAHRPNGWHYLGTVVVEGDGRSMLVCDSDPATAPDAIRVTVETGEQKDAPRGRVALEWSRSAPLP
jgi:RNA polymerase sigma-70 factor (ECF subfamily)